MCGTCGCGLPDPADIRMPGEIKNQGHLHYHHDASGHNHPHDREISVELDIMHKNDLLAERNRGYFEAKKIAAINMVSSPGSGKTTILERTINMLGHDAGIFVIEGDQQTMLDADRINKTGAPVVQVNTGNGCHLDAMMISMAVKKLDVPERALLLIENVGNLVCPALFDLGESTRVLIISVTEGEDKPLKYPNMFQSAQLCLINKSDLLPYVDFSVDKFKEYALRVNHHLEFLTISAKSGEGFNDWLIWLKKQFVVK
jgi:hydrogenase nickel incorporation protein HypB